LKAASSLCVCVRTGPVAYDQRTLLIVDKIL
jgi:hypothetical protein